MLGLSLAAMGLVSYAMADLGLEDLELSEADAPETEDSAITIVPLDVFLDAADQADL